MSLSLCAVTAGGIFFCLNIQPCLSCQSVPCPSLEKLRGWRNVDCDTAASPLSPPKAALGCQEISFHKFITIHLPRQWIFLFCIQGELGKHSGGSPTLKLCSTEKFSYHVPSLLNPALSCSTGVVCSHSQFLSFCLALFHLR